MCNSILSGLKSFYGIVCCFILLLVIGCNSSDSSKADSIKNNFVLEKMNKAKKPQSHIPSIRQYALNNFDGLSDSEYQLIQTTNPEITSDTNTMEYSFAWKLPDNGGYIEVLATPPPACYPMAVYRRHRVSFE